MVQRFPKFLKPLVLFVALRTGRLPAFLLLFFALYFQIADPSFLSNFRNRVFDYYQQWQPREAPDNRPVVIVDIDEKSLLQLGQWPWPRNYLAALVQNASRRGALVIGFDMVFAEEDRLSPDKMAQSVSALSEAAQKEIAALQSFDTVFSRQIEKSRVILGIAVNPTEKDVNNLGLEKIATFGVLGQDPKLFLPRFTGLIGNIPKLDQHASGRGMITLDQDFDGIVRRVPLATVVGDKVIPALTLDMLRVATGRNVISQANEKGLLGFKISGTLVPTDKNGRIWIQYSPYSPEQYISASDIIFGKVGPDRLRGKLLLVGTSATGLKDLRASPLQSALPGVEMHMQLLENILTQSYLFRPEYLAVFEWTGTVFTGLTLIILVPLVGARATMGLLLIIGSIAISSSLFLFSEYSLLIDVSYTLFISLILYITLVYSNYMSTETERTRIRTAFSRYLSPDLVSQLSASPESLVLGGEEKEMTFLFCDVRDFTGISEAFRDDPQGLTHLINRFLTPMTDEILSCNGTIDKYMGDAIMSFWNAPLDNPDHQQDAARAALGMLSRLEELNTELEQEARENNVSFTELKVGIGLNTGKCIVGNLGSRQRFDYSVLGDPVNLASRLEGQTKDYGFNIIVGEDTASALPGYALIELDLIAVKGRSRAIKIFGLIGLPEMTETDHFKTSQKLSTSFLNAYRAQDWSLAREFLKSMKEHDDYLHRFCDYFSKRIDLFEETPPPVGWDGVFKALRK
ncbi:MAG: adenylate/guanylate cyclase domain-containing protein [Sneathiella sp.]